MMMIIVMAKIGKAVIKSLKLGNVVVDNSGGNEKVLARNHMIRFVI